MIIFIILLFSDSWLNDSEEDANMNSKSLSSEELLKVVSSAKTIDESPKKAIRCLIDIELYNLRWTCKCKM